MEKKDYVNEVVNTGTSAEGIAIAKPMRGKQILEAIKATNGIIITTPENKINEAREHLAQNGFYVEPTTAATFAGFLKYYNENKSHFTGKIIIPLCGAGLKKD